MDAVSSALDFERAPSMGRKQRADVRVAALRAIADGYDISRQKTGWKVTQIAKVIEDLDVSLSTVRNAVSELTAEGYVELFDERMGAYRPTRAGRLALLRWEAMESARVTYISTDDEGS